MRESQHNLQKVLNLIRPYIPDEIACDVLPTLAQPHEGTLLLLKTAFNVPDEKLSEIRYLRENSQYLESQQNYNNLWREKILSVDDYCEKTMDEYLASSLEIVRNPNDLGKFPGLNYAIGVGFKLAREDYPLTQKQVFNEFFIAFSTLRRIEKGFSGSSPVEAYEYYFQKILPGNAPVAQRSLERILGNSENKRILFDKLQAFNKSMLREITE